MTSVRALFLAALIGIASPGLAAQPTRAAARAAALDSAQAPPSAAARQVAEPRSGAEFWIPFGSVFVPGLGQYLHGAAWTGVAYTATAALGYVLSGLGDATPSAPRDGRDQLASEGLHLAFTAGTLSAWDAFRRSMPAQGGVGKYAFFEPDENLADLLTAPLDWRLLGRWTTWIDLAFTAGVTAWILTEGPSDQEYPPLRANDLAFATSLSLNAAVGEEALFRGWLLPMLTQKTGGEFWVANFIQAALFGLGHPQADVFAFVIGAEAVYTGWLTRRNAWSIREGIFQHFWYDMAVVTASLLRDDRHGFTLMPITIRF